jgi:hypothetical protein
MKVNVDYQEWRKAIIQHPAKVRLCPSWKRSRPIAFHKRGCLHTIFFPTMLTFMRNEMGGGVELLREMLRGIMPKRAVCNLFGKQAQEGSGMDYRQVLSGRPGVFHNRRDGSSQAKAPLTIQQGGMTTKECI